MSYEKQREKENWKKLKAKLEKIKPSKEKVWLKHYDDGAYDFANQIPKNKILWDLVEEKLSQFSNVPAVKYMGKETTRENFKNEVYAWARTFRAMGIEEDEIVPIYGPYLPDFGTMLWGLNIIGGCPYFLKLALSKDDLEKETKDSKVAIVYDGMFNNVREVFEEERFKKVMVATVTDGMPSPKKEFVSFLNYFANKKNKIVIPKKDKYLFLDDAYQIANYYTGDVRAPFVPNRKAFITSSSGTTIGGVVKGTIATNESVIAQLKQSEAAKVEYYPGEKCLSYFPFTASTALACLFIYPMYYGMTVICDPRFSKEGIYKQIMHYKPQIVVAPGPISRCFFRELEKDISKGKKVSLEFIRMFIIGAAGITKDDEKWMNILMEKGNSENGVVTGYGMSEFFSVISYHKPKINLSHSTNYKHVTDVGIPYPGVDVKIVDENGKELGYNQRGELMVKAKSNFAGYYGKPVLTKETITSDNWVKTGDDMEIDKNGLLYHYGRLSDVMTSYNGEKIKLYDLGLLISMDKNIKYCEVVNLGDNDNILLVAHVVFDNVEELEEETLARVDANIASFLPENLSIVGYKKHIVDNPVHSTTAKIDRNALSEELEGYVKPGFDGLLDLKFEKDEKGVLLPIYSKRESEVFTKVKKLIKL